MGHFLRDHVLLKIEHDLKGKSSSAIVIANVDPLTPSDQHIIHRLDRFPDYNTVNRMWMFYSTFSSVHLQDISKLKSLQASRPEIKTKIKTCRLQPLKKCAKREGINLHDANQPSVHRNDQL